MDQNQPSTAQWRVLYEQALKFKQIECWDWMTDDQVFGVMNPTTGEIGYCCVIGNLGEVFGLIAYTGTDGLVGYLKLRSLKKPGNNLESLNLQKGFSITFDNKEYLEKEDREVLKALGLQLRGPNAYPVFKNLSPGYFPWFIDGNDADFLNLVLQQAIDVCQRYKVNNSLLDITPSGYYLVQVPETRDGVLHWQDQKVKPEPLPVKPDVGIEIDEIRIQRILCQASRSQLVWEFDCAYADIPIQETGRPYFPQALFIVDSESGFIFGNHIAGPATYQQEFVDTLLDVMEKQKLLPREILVAKDEAAAMLESLLSKLEIKLTKAKKCREAEKARKSLEKYISARR